MNGIRIVTSTDIQEKFKITMRIDTISPFDKNVHDDLIGCQGSGGFKCEPGVQSTQRASWGGEFFPEGEFEVGAFHNVVLHFCWGWGKLEAVYNMKISLQRVCNTKCGIMTYNFIFLNNLKHYCANTYAT